MSRNASGTHSLPTGNPVVAGTTADPVAHNATMSDISAEITDSLSRSGKGGMSAPLVHTAGSAAAPSVTFTGDLDTGVYASAANEVAVTTGGTQRGKFSSAGLSVTGAIAATTGVSGTTGTFTDAVSGTTGTFSGAGSFGGNVDMNSHKITELTDGTAATDAATYGQVYAAGTLAAGTDWTIASDPSNPKYCIRIGKMCFVRFTATATVGSAAWSSIITLPEGFRPQAYTELLVGTINDGGTLYDARFSASTSGVVEATHYDNGTNLTTPPGLATGDKVTLTCSFNLP